MAISDHFSVDVTARIIYHDDSDPTIYTLNELYSWLMDYFDESGTIDDTIPITAQTPTAYTLTNGWYIVEKAYATYQYLKTGSITSVGHDASTYSYGIYKKAYDASGAGTPFSSADIGRIITETDSSDTGYIVDYDTSLGVDIGYVYIRPISGVDFADTNSAYTVAGSSAAGSFNGAPTTGENTWTNIYTIGTLQANTQLYIYQSDVEITPWWSTGHLDIILKTQANGNLIDSGMITVFARQYTKLYDHYLADLSSGARTPIPLATFTDSNNSTGFRSFTYTPGTGTFQTGEIVQKVGSPTYQGIITAVGTSPNSLTYYLFQSPISNDFANTDSITGITSSATGTVASIPAAAGPATYSGITFTFGATSQNLNNGAGSRPYDVIIDINGYSLADFYQYLKYLTCYGSTTSLNGHIGADYVAVGDIRLPFDNQTGNFTENLTVTGTNSGATGIIVSNHDSGSTGALVLRDVSGAFEDNEILTDTSSGSATVDLSLALDEIAASKQSPFGTYAGGTFIGARGVWLTGYQSNEANNYLLYDSTNILQIPPATIAIEVNSVEAGDRVSVFVTDGATETIKRDMYYSHASNNSKNDTDFEVTLDIATDTPTTGVIRVIDNSLNKETRYTYSSWSGRTFSGLSPNLVTNYESTDTAYVPYIDEVAVSDTVSVSVTYAQNRDVLVVVRYAGFLPYKTRSVVNTAGMTIAAIKTTDSIYQ